MRKSRMGIVEIGANKLNYHREQENCLITVDLHFNIEDIRRNLLPSRSTVRAAHV